ncbi:hypothetical protein HD597_005486 [Nonomuraea thailandensis]|uniref:Uncharacterized protein n=1 Tax=Nonomuraea thailandensis TaxID=1188745 RepID=A0A9X2K692_9ACTN|nr:hypothetical protein [Nonomuraea thailandensis]MCP2358466.1 hypothetical protein [Nonomuraea thailandensis]
MALITTCRSILKSRIVWAGTAGVATTGAVVGLVALVNRIPQMLWLIIPLMPVYFLLALPLGALAGRLVGLPRPGGTTCYGWLVALIAGQALAWLPGGFDTAARIFVVAPALALFILPMGFAVAAAFTLRAR